MANDVDVKVHDLFVAAAFVGSLCEVLVFFGALVITLANDLTALRPVAMVLPDKQNSDLRQ